MENFFGKLSGVDLLIFYDLILLQSIGYSKHETFLSSLIIMLVQALSKMIGALLIQRIVRRITFLLAYILVIFPLVWMGIMFYLNRNIHHHFKHKRSTISISLVLAHIIGRSIVSGPYGWLNDIFPIECVDIAASYGMCLGFLATFLSNQVFFHVICELRLWALFMYGTFCIL